MHRVYLSPGMFGFAELGAFGYFSHLRSALLDELKYLGLDAEVHVVDVPPTASIRRRAARLAEAVAETSGPHDDIHLVGHSTGSPRWDLPKGLSDAGETPIDCDRRESHEEFGLVFAATRLIDLGRYAYYRSKDLHLFAVRTTSRRDPTRALPLQQLFRDGPQRHAPSENSGAPSAL